MQFGGGGTLWNNPRFNQGLQSSEVGFGEWFLTIFLTAIPLVGLVLLFVWAFGSTTNPSKANWVKAGLAWAAIGIVIYLIVFVVILGIWGVTQY